MKLKDVLLVTISGISQLVFSFNCGTGQKSLECRQLMKIINRSCIKLGKSKLAAELKCLNEEENLELATECMYKLCSETDERMDIYSQFLSKLANGALQHIAQSKRNQVLGSHRGIDYH